MEPSVSAFLQALDLALSMLADMDEAEKIEALNGARIKLHEVSPFRAEPIDCVLWVQADAVGANDYNPNSVAPPEMDLLRLSIRADGYTQPIVGFRDGERIEVVDGFHRNRVGKECPDVRKRIKGYLPVVVIKDSRAGKADRMASTIRHNRARGKHGVPEMSKIVVELKRRMWTDAKIAKELGMSEDEVLRLKQVTGLAAAFADREFSKSWEIEQ